MTPEEIDNILVDAANRSLSPGEDRAAIKRAQGAILTDLRPVMPLAPLWVFTLAFLTIFVALAAVTGSVLGLHGIHALNTIQRALIFPALFVSSSLAAAACAREMRPAAGLHLGATALIVTAGLFPLLFSVVFEGYGTLNFVPEGIPCLVAGMCVAIPTGVITAWILRRGFVLDWCRAGTAGGALSGLTGLAMLELHCANLKAIHVMVWHVAVVIVSGILGFGVGRIVDSLRRRKI